MKLLTALLAIPVALGAPVLEPRASASVIPGSWIVVLKDNVGVQSLSDKITKLLGGSPKRTYKFGTFNGFHLDATDSLINTIASLTEIAYIQPDERISINALTTQAGATWGLARISSREPGSPDYIYDESAGKGTHAYIIDTGIFTAHPEFEGRASMGASFVEEAEPGDGNGHGTHVAGTVGSKTYGVAKKTTLIGVKVLDSAGTGATSTVIAGLEWAVTHATNNGWIKKSVANMSIGGLRLLGGQAINKAAAAAVNAGLFLSVAAGNDGLPAELTSPASEPSVCTVGATDNKDSRASFSNWGNVVDIFAPGVNITSTWNDGATNTISGTSMAAPHVAGLGAYILALEGEFAPKPLCERLQALATKDTVRLALSKNNLLAYNGQSA